MAFNTNDRVIVSSERSAYRRRSGTVVSPAANNSDGLNRVRLDGYPKEGVTVSLSDKELRLTSFNSPIQYV